MGVLSKDFWNFGLFYDLSRIECLIYYNLSVKFYFASLALNFFRILLAEGSPSL
jgi:hypothetical protein